MEIVTLQQAKKAGLKKYFTGEPCARGHVTFRRTDTRACWDCYKQILHKWRCKNRELLSSINKKSNEARKATRLPKKRLASKEDYRKHPEYYLEKTNARRAGVRRNTPSWSDRDVIRSIYARARKISIETGIEHEVDHIVPLKGATVCGLHVQFNLQILTKTENRWKRNRLLDAA